jgi:hypothetical protein
MKKKDWKRKRSDPLQKGRRGSYGGHVDDDDDDYAYLDEEGGWCSCCSFSSIVGAWEYYEVR